MRLPAFPSIIALILLLPLVSVAAPAQAGKQVGQEEHQARQWLQSPRMQSPRMEIQRVQKQGISRDEAAALVQRRYGGKILSISEEQKGGRTVYRVKGLSDRSQVYVVFVDKQSGRISG